MHFTGLQDVVVALVAVAAAAVVLRRLMGVVAAESSPKCAKCESGACAPVTTPSAREDAPAPAAVHPLVLVRPPRQ